MSRLFINFFILLIVTLASVNAQCGRNEVWTNCGRRFACQKNCDDINNPITTICSANCEAGCVCKSGFVRRSRRSKTCVLEINCQR